MSIIKPKTVASVTAIFTKAIKDLRAVEAKNYHMAGELYVQQNDLNAKRDAALAEAQNASVIAAKLEALVV